MISSFESAIGIDVAASTGEPRLVSTQHRPISAYLQFTLGSRELLICYGISNIVRSSYEASWTATSCDVLIFKQSFIAFHGSWLQLQKVNNILLS